MSKQVLLVTNVLCRSGSTIAIALSIVSGRSVIKPEFPRVPRVMAYATQYPVIELFGAPTNLLSIIPSPLKKPRIDTSTSLTATLMMKMF